ncbi:MFS transporter, partial [Pseudomonas syringae pv. tagetis]
LACEVLMPVFFEVYWLTIWLSYSQMAVESGLVLGRVVAGLMLVVWAWYCVVVWIGGVLVLAVLCLLAWLGVGRF